ncbi:MAG: rhomboid family intramembrane serine protease [Verrucomicrobia bacterium]|nr:rhomboid family intramembrane serine protease [Verrucomicrobiota bacterium]
MELNHLFLFVAVASSLVVCGQSIRLRNRRVGLAAALVLFASALTWLFVPRFAGWIAALFWFALLILPAYRANRLRAARDPFYRTRQQRIQLSPVVLTLIALNVVAFAGEIYLGGSTNPLTLERLGWLDTDLVIFEHQYWRLLTALFLHFGTLHLVVNMFALLLLGPPLEREAGAATFATYYLLSGIGSSLIVVLLTRYKFLQPVQLVGASGCIMGIVGAWGGFLLRNRHLPLASRRLRNLVLIVLLQTAFDILTPRVSMSAHLGGLSCGLFLGLLLPGGERRPWY